MGKIPSREEQEGKGCLTESGTESSLISSERFRGPRSIWRPSYASGANRAVPCFDFPILISTSLWFAKTLADFEINDIAALPPLFCYNS